MRDRESAAGAVRRLWRSTCNSRLRQETGFSDAACSMTTPLGGPVAPEVKTTCTVSVLPRGTGAFAASTGVAINASISRSSCASLAQAPDEHSAALDRVWPAMQALRASGQLSSIGT